VALEGGNDGNCSRQTIFRLPLRETRLFGEIEVVLKGAASHPEARRESSQTLVDFARFDGAVPNDQAPLQGALAAITGQRIHRHAGRQRASDDAVDVHGWIDSSRRHVQASGRGDEFEPASESP
jgi:hypothetical protein